MHRLLYTGGQSQRFPLTEKSVVRRSGQVMWRNCLTNLTLSEIMYDQGVGYFKEMLTF